VTGGEFKLGHNVEVDYFAQDQYKALNPDARVYDDLRDLSPRRTETELRNLLGSFLFSDEDVFKPIGVLSGGERNRYALARMLLQPSNFLLLDEPTNHLDMRAKDVLLEALSDFTGTVVFVSHDRYFIDKLATRVIEIEGGAVTVYPGNYEDYLWRKEQAAIPPAPAAAPQQPAEATKVQKKANPQKSKHLAERIASIETEIANLESASAELLARMGSANGATGHLARELGEKRQRISQLESEWEDATAALAS
jgi:ATP-binding cassette subfamily F protein 3